MSKYEDAVKVGRLALKIRQAIPLITIPEAGTVGSLDDETGQGNRFIGFVIRSELLEDKEARNKLEEVLSEAIIYTQGNIIEKALDYVNAWEKKVKELAIKEAQGVIKDLGENK